MFEVVLHFLVLDRWYFLHRLTYSAPRGASKEYRNLCVIIEQIIYIQGLMYNHLKNFQEQRD